MEALCTAYARAERSAERLGGWRCDALQIPGAKLLAVYSEGAQMDPRQYRIDDRAITWSGEMRPRELLAKIQLTKDLPELEQTKIRLEKEKIDLERQKYLTERRWKIISGVGAVVGAVLTFFGTHYFGNPKVEQPPKIPAHVVPAVEPEKIRDLPDESIDSNFDLLKDISVFDLRSWVPVANSARNTRHSPVNYINYLHLKKKKSVQKYIAHYSTSGFAIDLRCITQPGKVFRIESPDHPGDKTYSLEVDVSREKLGVDFLVVVEGTYWNGFGNEKQESASTYTDTDITALGELALVVLFPDNKPLKSFHLLEKPEASKEFVSYVDDSRFYSDTNNRFIYWSVTGRHPNTHYKIDWQW